MLKENLFGPADFHETIAAIFFLAKVRMSTKYLLSDVNKIISIDAIIL